MKHKKIVQISSIGIFLILINSCNYESPSEQHIYHSEYGDFDFLSYTYPDYENYKVGDLNMHTYSYDFNNFSYSASFYDLDTVLASDDLILNNLIGGAIGKADVAVDTILDITYRGHPGKEIFVYSRNGTEGRARFLLIDNRKVYTLVVTNDGSRSIKDRDVEIFLNSFYSDVKKYNSLKKSVVNSTSLFNSKLTIKQLKQLLYANIGYSQYILIKGGWKQATEFDKLKMISGNQFHVYNFLYPSRDSLIFLSVCPFAYITYQPSKPDIVKLRDSIISKYIFVKDIISSGIRQLYFRSSEDSFIINIHQEITWFEIWKGVVAVENLNALNKNRLFQEFNIKH